MKKFASLLFVFLFIACGGKRALKYFTPEEQYRKALIDYKSGNYKRALDGFKKLLYNFNAGPYMDDAQFYIGECYMGMKDYASAIEEFKFFLSTFPGSELVPQVTLELARAYIEKTKDPTNDVEDVKKAIELIRDFLSTYEKSPLRGKAHELLRRAKNKLAERMLSASIVYHKLGKYESERLYLELIIDEYQDTYAYWEAKLRLGKLLIEIGEKDKGISILKELAVMEGVPLNIRAEARSFLAEKGIS